ncbi:carbon-nitrogen hydrolase family protein [Novosphingobium rosa]|uniref:carbon-nitrogen hydrolase family protein n=1 Tax=Novosphingobium rosa TaxID=76978 RepID=UPI00082ED719|nr:carbon-nitrogen hydrolase family protein [Novosphingobium rosa]
MRISVCQMNSRADKAENTRVALELLDEAKRQGAEVAVLPECLDYMGPDEGVYPNSEEEGGPLWTALADKARELGIWVIGGTFRVRAGDDSRVGNTLVVFNPAGEATATYRKMHMFDIVIPGEVDFMESRTVKPGEDVVTTQIAGVQSGLSICFDLRFPELFRLQALAGARILFLPAAFTAFTGKAHWEILLRARAIENTCFVVAAGQDGENMPGKASHGQSIIIDPWGEIVAQAPAGVGVTTADIDLDQLDKVRRNMPSLQNRRADIYSLSLAQG